MAAVGSAIGPGNIWRYPYVAYENGGGAFLVPHFIALFTAGIPILIMEWSLGNKYQGSGLLEPLTMIRVGRVVASHRVFVTRYLRAGRRQLLTPIRSALRVTGVTDLATVFGFRSRIKGL